ncbi:MAG TPA: zinc-ribbon domain-containing protein, partial [Candidatus Eisenbacteria bacterium]|nr:zinc-ribbon domain-containing protein [Candidatus Eisenbacteria bacterium]
MKLECLSCNSRYTIDDAIIPPQGARVRCRKCGAVIQVSPPAARPALVEPAPSDTPVVPPPSETPVVPPPALPPISYTAPASPAAESTTGFSFLSSPAEAHAEPARTALHPAPPAAASPVPPGLSQEEKAKHEKARRLARVLASDIAIYNREKKDRGLAEGNLVAVLGYEIKKSWEIYKERVGA